MRFPAAHSLKAFPSFFKLIADIRQLFENKDDTNCKGSRGETINYRFLCSLFLESREIQLKFHASQFLFNSLLLSH